jgi:ribose/xylose/arabinose/galactoside ABC-type transport system permease subunit
MFNIGFIFAVTLGIMFVFLLFFSIIVSIERNKKKNNKIENFGDTDSRLYVAIPVIIIVIVLILVIAHNVISGKRK